MEVAGEHADVMSWMYVMQCDAQRSAFLLFNSEAALHQTWGCWQMQLEAAC